MSDPMPAPGSASPVLKDKTLVVGSVLTLAAVVAALVITLAFGAQRTSTDEAALRAIITGSSAAASIDGAQAAQLAPAVSPAAEARLPVAQPTGEAVATQPTAAPAPALPTATPVPQFISPTPLPAMPTPGPTTAEGTNETRLLSPGWVTMPVGPGVSFELSQQFESVQLPGISAIYVNAGRTGEVDIFTPVATASGQLLHTFDDVVNYLETNPLFSSLEQRPTALWRELGAVGYRGTATQFELGFYTDPANVGNNETGWRLPSDLEIWVIPSPTGPIVVTAEAIDSDALAFGRARDLQSRVLDFIQFGTG